MSKNVNKLLKGASDVVLAAVDESGNPSPTEAGDIFPLLSLGFIDQDSIQANEKNRPERRSGNTIQLGQIASLMVKSLEVAAGGVDVAKKFRNVRCDVYGFGSQQSHKLTPFLINVETIEDLKTSGKSVVMFSGEKKIDPSASIGTLGAAAAYYATTAAYKLNEIVKKLSRDNVIYEVYPYLGNFGVSGKLYDASDSREVGVNNNGPLQITLPDGDHKALSYDGVNDSTLSPLNFLIPPSSFHLQTTLLIEMWLKCSAMVDDGYLFEIAADPGSDSSFLNAFTDASGRISLVLTDSAPRNSSAITDDENFVAIGDWRHIGFQLSFDGENDSVLKIFKDGIEGAVTSDGFSIDGFDDITKISIAKSLLYTSYGPIVLGALRIHKFDRILTDTEITNILKQNSAAEQAIFT